MALEIGKNYRLDGPEILVRACGTAMTIENDDPYWFKEGEYGILRTIYDGSHGAHQIWELAVVWDGDSKRKARPVMPMIIAVAGLEVDRRRLCPSTTTLEPCS
jgi:hypothetical protein